ncbi:hypothetical protein VKT23_017080 [Stygiomarasmius scandens]|uniref:Uncharacterized protein n=1 Tax=Marasmiellus scandens TaxID=2682957 RepID=A0ABR1ITF4_9AGAR
MSESAVAGASGATGSSTNGTKTSKTTKTVARKTVTDKPKRKRRKTGWSSRKSTGGAAPRRPLGVVTDFMDIDVDHEIISTSPTTEDPRQCERAEEENEKSSNIEGQGLTAELESESKLDYTDDFARLTPEDKWCVGCGDSTTYSRKAECRTCGQIVCFAGPGSKACLEVSPLFAKKGMSPGDYFICPQCTKKDHWMKKLSGYVIYSGFFSSRGQPLHVIENMRWCDFTFFKAPKLPTLGLLQIELDEEMLEGRVPYSMTKLKAEGFASGVVCASEVITHELSAPDYPAHNVASPRPLVTEVVKFDFSTGARTAQYQAQIRRVITAFRRMGVDEVVVFLATHADPDRGDLHFIPHGGGAEALEVLFPELFPRDIQQWFSSVKSHLFIGMLDNIICFPTPQFQPRKAASFTAGFVEQVIYKQIPIETGINHVLRDNFKLGIHSKILRLTAAATERGATTCRAVRYVWTQETRRPWGIEYPIQCPKCQSMQSFSAVGDLAYRPRLKVWECRSRLVGDGIGLGSPCLEAFEVELDETECNLLKGTKEGMWQQHEFKWSEGLMRRF